MSNVMDEARRRRAELEAEAEAPVAATARRREPMINPRPVVPALVLWGAALVAVGLLWGLLRGEPAPLAVPTAEPLTTTTTGPTEAPAPTGAATARPEREGGTIVAVNCSAPADDAERAACAATGSAPAALRPQPNPPGAALADRAPDRPPADLVPIVPTEVPGWHPPMAPGVDPAATPLPNFVIHPEARP